MPTRSDDESLEAWREVGESGDSDDRAHSFLKVGKYVKVYGQVVHDGDLSVVADANAEDVDNKGRVHIVSHYDAEPQTGPTSPSRPRNVELEVRCEVNAVRFGETKRIVRFGRRKTNLLSWQPEFDVEKSGVDSCVRIRIRPLNRSGAPHGRMRRTDCEVHFRVRQVEGASRNAPRAPAPKYDVAISYSSRKDFALRVKKRLLAYGWEVFAYSTTDAEVGQSLEAVLEANFSVESRVKLFVLTLEDYERRYPRLELEAALAWWGRTRKHVCVYPFDDKPLPELPEDLLTFRKSDSPDPKAVALALHRILRADNASST